MAKIHFQFNLPGEMVELIISGITASAWRTDLRLVASGRRKKSRVGVVIIYTSTIIPTLVEQEIVLIYRFYVIKVSEFL